MREQKAQRGIGIGQSVLAEVWMRDQEYRAMRILEHTGRDTAKQITAQAAVPMAADQDQIRGQCLRSLADLIGRMAASDLD